MNRLLLYSPKYLPFTWISRHVRVIPPPAAHTWLAHAHATTLPPYTTVERHRPDGEDIRACAREDIPEEAGLSSDEFITIEAPPEPPPKMQRGRWKTTAPPGGAAVRCSLHEAENELNEIQQADSI
ncbi:hypothetical protein Bbelb_340140 [Branchiostoma belcheri]|nr:hypothetical protein Bbelb_340140 [Branchiostoma belcheri]